MHRRSARVRFALWIAAGAVPLSASGCDGATADGSAAATDVSAAQDVGAVDAAMAADVPVLQTEPAPPATAYVELTGEWLADSKRMRVTVWIGGFKDLLGIAGHLRYDPAALELADLQSHPVPAVASDDASLWTAHSIAKDSPAGRILMGGARFRKTPSPFLGPEGAAAGRQPWLTAEFAVLQPGKHTIAFDPDSTAARNDMGESVPTFWGKGTVVTPAEAP